MGTWGPGIFSDDLACDVRNSYREFVGDGYDGSQATKKLEQIYKESISDPEERPVFYLALAATQWKCGRLERSVKDVALRIIDSGDDLRRWGDNPKQYLKRQQVLSNLETQLNSPQCEPKRIQKKFKDSTEFEPGDAVSYRLDSGRYAILRVLGLATDAGGTRPIFELCDWTGFSIPLKEAIDKFPYRHPTLKGFGTKFLVGSVSKREYPKDRLELVARGVNLYQKGNPPYTIIFWRDFNEKLKGRFSLV